MNTLEIIKLLEEGNNIITKKIIVDLIDEKKETDELYAKLYSEYKGDVPILKKVRPLSIPDYKANNTLPSGLRGLIISQGVTFSIGKVSKVNTPDKTTQDLVTEFRRINKIHKKDLSLLTMGCVCGVSGRLLFFDKEANVRIKTMNSWEYLIVKDATTDLAQYGLIYYDISKVDIMTNETKTVKKVELYDNKIIRTFEIDGSVITETESPMFHGFDYVPIVQYENEKKQGDFYEEAWMIDAYEVLMSVTQDELEDFRTIYLQFKGVEPTIEQMELAKYTGGFGSEDPNFDVSYVEKNGNSDSLREHLERIRHDIFRSSSRYDFRDNKSTAQSGVARIFELQSLEDDCALKKAEMQSISSDMYRILSSGVAKKYEKIEWETVDTEYRSNLPIDLTYYSDFIQKTFGKLPLIEIYKQLPFVENAEEAVLLFNNESSGMLNELG